MILYIIYRNIIIVMKKNYKIFLNLISNPQSPIPIKIKKFICCKRIDLIYLFLIIKRQYKI